MSMAPSRSLEQAAKASCALYMVATACMLLLAIITGLQHLTGNDEAGVAVFLVGCFLALPDSVMPGLFENHLGIIKKILILCSGAAAMIGAIETWHWSWPAAAVLIIIFPGMFFVLRKKLPWIQRI